MSERLKRDLTGYIESWESKPQPQVIEEMASWSLETKRFPDPYSFLVRPDGKLISPITGELVGKSIERTSYLGREEGKAFDKIQEWDRDKNSGLSFWISPPHPDRSIFTKVIGSELLTRDDGSKELFNRSIMLDLDSNQALALHQKLCVIGGHVLEPLSSEDIRSRPVFLENINTNEWVNFLQIEIEDQPILDMIRTGEDISEKEKALQNSVIVYDQLYINNQGVGYDDDRIKDAMQVAENINMFGQYDSTCPTAFQLMFDAGIDGKLVKNCGACKAYLNKVMKAQDTCPHCGGVYKGC